LANLEPLARLERVCALMDRPDAPTNAPHTFDPRDRVGSDAVRQR
jgi:hypothetical protein